MSAGVLGLILKLLLAGAAADPREMADNLLVTALAIEASGECPRGDGVMAALVSVVGRNVSSPLRDPPRVVNLGDRFEVVVAGQTGQYADPARDCVERARVAAVFIALTLNPPTVRSAGTAASPPAEPPRGAPAPATGWAQFAVATRIDGAASGTEGLDNGALGLEVRGALGRRSLGVGVGAGALTSVTSRYGSVSVHQRRFPLNLAATARHRVFRSLEVGGSLGLSLVLLTMRAEGLSRADPATRLDLGARLSFELRFPALVPSVVPFVGVHAEFFPRPYALDVNPLGEIGQTSRLWLGASVGVAFDR